MPDGRASMLVIRTPEGYAFSYPLAGPVTRFLAWMIDFLVLVAALWALSIVLIPLLALIPAAAYVLQIIAMFALTTGYKIVLEWFWGGQTIGKRALRLRVMDIQALRLSFAQVLLRNLLRAIDMLPLFYMVGGLTALLTRHGQRLGDLVAGTVVVRSPRSFRPNLEQVLADDRFNSFREHPHLEARLRQQVTPDEARLAAQAMLRRESLDPHSRLELFDELAEHFAGIVTFPQQATDGLSGEQYVRNVVETLYRPQMKTESEAL